MRISENWLREWVNPAVAPEQLERQLTMAGLKVDAVFPAAPASLDGVVVGRVTSCSPHPNADKLTVCEVDDGKGRRSVVCGAPNVNPGMCAPLALPGAELAGGRRVGVTEIRGVQSDGMLCSGAELGLSDDAATLMELPPDCTPGAPLAQLLALDDRIMEIDLTPNRGDCLSVLGVAREVAAINGLELASLDERVVEIAAAHDERLEVAIADPQDCAVYCGRIVRGVDASRNSPLWMQERLRRGGIRPINAVVDVTAYVMLELGQPMHAFDLAKLAGPVSVRRGRAGERLELLDGTVVEPGADMLLIADASGPVALAGVMGGAATAVSPDTTDVFLESACFLPPAMAGRVRRLDLHTEASQRFERGVDPALAMRAIQRATGLLVEIAGGSPGPVSRAGSEEIAGPRARPIVLRRERIGRLLGVTIADEEVEDLLRRLHMRVKADPDGWMVTAPGFRYDIEIEADLVEEVARLYGYDNIPARDAASPARLHPLPEARVADSRLRGTLVQRGYQEVITYSFVDPALQRALRLDDGAINLLNPISQDLGQMRTSLWAGLLACLGYNLNRQQSRVRIFESGLIFIRQDNDIKQEKMLAGLAYGERNAEQWGLPATRVDFYDLKGDLEALLNAGGAGDEYRFEAADHPTLHPGQAARILRDDIGVGWIGSLHPELVRTLDFPHSPVLFEIDAATLAAGRLPRAGRVSRFPALRRDLALRVPEEVSVSTLLEQVRAVGPEWLREVRLFDIYRGQGIEDGIKSIALGLILQESSRTLTDSEVDAFVRELVEHLGRTVNATIRD